MIFMIALFISPPVVQADEGGMFGTLHEYAPVSFWINTASFLDDPNLNETYETMAAAAVEMGKTCYDANAVKTALSQMFAADFGAVAINSNQTFTYYKPDGSIEAICQYEYVGPEIVDWMGYQMEWHKYEQITCMFMPDIESEQFIYTPYKYVVSTQVHQDGGEGMIHAHIRFGSTSFDDLMNGEAYSNWWPTLGLYGATTLDVYMQSIPVEELVFMLPDCEADEN
jgi:hypothetical protein